MNLTLITEALHARPCRCQGNAAYNPTGPTEGCVGLRCRALAEVATLRQKEAQDVEIMDKSLQQCCDLQQRAETAEAKVAELQRNLQLTARELIVKHDALAESERARAELQGQINEMFALIGKLQAVEDAARNDEARNLAVQAALGDLWMFREKAITARTQGGKQQ